MSHPPEGTDSGLALFDDVGVMLGRHSTPPRTRRAAARRGTAGTVLLLLAGCSHAVVDAGAAGDPATWELLAPGKVTAASQTLDIGVTRLGCASGVTGEVLAPRVEHESDRVVISVDVAPFGEDAAECQDNDVVPVTVEMDEAVGHRDLVDGACLAGEAVGTASCETAVRWTP